MTAVRPAEEVAGRERSGGRGASLPWLALIAVLTIAGAAVPLAFSSRYYFVGDTEAGAYGQWWWIGERLMAGDWSPINPTAWQAGVYIADGAWGLYSPVLWLVGLGTHLVADTLLFMFLLKTAVLLTAAFGVRALARGYGVGRAWAALAAVAVPFAGFTSYQEITSWITGAMSWALLPWAWAGARAFVHRRRTIAAPLVPAFLLLGIAYTHATLMLVLVALLVFGEAVIARSRPSILRALVSGAITAAGVVFVHLPALLTFPDTGREQGLYNSGRLTVDWSALVQAAMPFGPARMLNNVGDPVGQPFTYVAWFLPLVVLVDWRRAGEVLRTRLGLPAFALVLLVAVQLPSDIGPLRWPGRLLPYLVVAVVLLLVLLLDRARMAHPSGRRLLAAAGLVAVSSATTWTWNTSSWAGVLVGGVGLALLVPLAAVLVSRSRAPQRVVAGLAVVSVLLLVPQHAVLPTPAGTRHHLATDTRTYQAMLPAAEGDVFVVGDIRDDPGASDEIAVANAWYLTGRPVQNAYTTLAYPPYTERFCLSIKGSACPEAFETLFEIDPETGVPWVDLLAVSSVLLVTASFEGSGVDPTVVPDGWRLAEATDHTRLLVRDEPVSGSGGVVWASPGVEVRDVRSSATRVAFTVDGATAGGRVVLSRIDWPGYAATGALLAPSVGGFLLTVDTDDVPPGGEVVVEYTPPGRAIRAGAAIVGLLLLAGWALSRVPAVRRGFRTARAGADAS